MIVNFKKSGFSLAESLISLMLLVMVVMLTMTSITKKKVQQISKSTAKGSYACWYDEDKGLLSQKRYDGNINVASINQHPSECSLKMNRRVSKYYIIATGSRKCNSDSCVDGQTIQKVIPTPSGADESEMTLNIKLGDSDEASVSANGGITTVEHKGIKDENKIKALGGVLENNSGLVSGNIEEKNDTCKIISSNIYSCSGKLSCKISNTIDKKIKYENPYSTAIHINCDSGGISTTACVIEDINSLKLKDGTYSTNECKNESGGSFSVKMKIVENDSAFKASKSKGADKSEFVKYLKMIPPNRQNALTGEILKYYLTPPKNKKGVVLILW